MPPYQIAVLLMLAAGMQFGLLGLALLIELSHRKRRPVQIRRPAREARRKPRAERGRPAPAEGPAPETFQGEAAAETEAVATPEAAPAAEAAVPAEEHAAAETATEPEPPPPAISRIGLGLKKTREAFMARIRAALGGGIQREQLFEELEEALIAADVGVETSTRIVGAVRERLKNDARPETVRAALKDEIERILMAVQRTMAETGDEPLVVMLVGVNGAGKTTTVAKLAARFRSERGPVIVAAADTFRAAAIDQLEVWCNRVGAEIIKQKQGSDPAAIAFDAVAAARARAIKTVLIDTAGRLQTKSNLMDELKKIARVAGRNLAGAPHESWLVLDATTGQNALSQAQVFKEAVPLTGVILAKLDSTAKGGVVIAIAERMKLPVRFVGIGEGVEDLRPFDPHEFVEALFEGEDSAAQSASGSYAA